MQEHFRGPGKVLPPQAETMVQSPSHELPASVSSRLNSGLCFPCTQLWQCLPWDRAQYHLSFSCSYPWTLHCLLSPSCNTTTLWLLVLSRSFQQLELATGTASIIQLPLTRLPHSPQVPGAQKLPQSPSPGTSQALHSSQHSATAAAGIGLTILSYSSSCSNENS